jgi:hypothetical protein
MSGLEADRHAAARERLFNELVAETRGFYSQLATVASAFLGGSVLFRDKLPDVPACNWLLGVAWTSFALSLVLIVLVRLNNIAGAEQLIDMIDGKRPVTTPSDGGLSAFGRGCTIGAVVLLVVGVIALVAFGWASLYA